MAKKTSIGGQALIEGLMMKGPQKTAISIRRASGEIVTTVEETKKAPKLMTYPILRGGYGFIQSLREGMKAIEYSASFLEEDLPEEEPGRFELFMQKHFGQSWDKIITPVAMVLGVLLAVFLFMFLPAFLTSFLNPVLRSNIAKNLVEGAVRIAIFLVYLILISKMKDIERVFMYHGAEHKTIFCYEKGAELTVENVKTFSRFHPRCGTSFLLIVMVVGILLFAVVTWDNILQRILLKLLLLPLVVGVSYELLKFAGRHDESPLVKILIAPGFALQRLTTKEPDDSMIEVAIEAFKAVAPEGGGGDSF